MIYLCRCASLETSPLLSAPSTIDGTCYPPLWKHKCFVFSQKEFTITLAILRAEIGKFTTTLMGFPGEYWRLKVLTTTLLVLGYFKAVKSQEKPSIDCQIAGICVNWEYQVSQMLSEDSVIQDEALIKTQRQSKSKSHSLSCCAGQFKGEKHEDRCDENSFKTLEKYYCNSQSWMGFWKTLERIWDANWVNVELRGLAQMNLVGVYWLLFSETGVRRTWNFSYTSETWTIRWNGSQETAVIVLYNLILYHRNFYLRTGYNTASVPWFPLSFYCHW